MNTDISQSLDVKNKSQDCEKLYFTEKFICILNIYSKLKHLKQSFGKISEKFSHNFDTKVYNEM